MAKARDAFRTISEVSEWLDTPAHVLRFWESKFSQIKPVKRAGGRRYYRPDDMALLAGIKKLLHEQGMTIKGAQKLLREKGVKHVAAMSPPVTGEEDAPDVVIDSKAVAPEADVVSAPETKAAPVAEPAATDAAPVAAKTPMAPAMPPPMRPAFVAESNEADGAPTEAAHEPTPAPAPIALPTTPAEPAAVEPRLLGDLQSASAKALRAKAAEIAPLLARLEEVRDRMRAN